MNRDQIIWLVSFFIFFLISIFVTAGKDKQKKMIDIFSNKITWLFSLIVIGFLIPAIFSNNTSYKKACMLAFVALLIAFFSELHMIFAPFFLTLCMVMAFPELF